MLLIPFGRRRSSLFVQRGTTFGLEPPFPAGATGTRGDTWDLAALRSFQALGHTCKSHLAIFVLRPPLGGSDHQATWLMDHAHASLNLIALLSARSASNKKLDATIAL